VNERGGRLLGRNIGKINVKILIENLKKRKPADEDRINSYMNFRLKDGLRKNEGADTRYILWPISQLHRSHTVIEITS